MSRPYLLLHFRRWPLWLVGIALFFCAIAVATARTKTINDRPQLSATLKQLLKTYTEVLDLTEEYYADPFSSEKAIGESIQNMLRRLDPHSNFYDAESFRKFQEFQSGNFSGIGIQIAIVDGEAMVLYSVPGSPSHALGLKPGDVISKIEGMATRGWSSAQVAEKLRGPNGTEVKVSIQRLGVKEPFELTLVRDEIPQRSVRLSYLIRPKVAYLQLIGFTATTEKEVNNALDKLGKDLNGFILDLRDNPGGYLQAAIAVADRFLQMDQAILITKGRVANSNYRYAARRGNQGQFFPLIVLINERSASASEIVAGSIQDHDRGLIVGENSFGKGLVQTIYPLSAGTALSLTTAKWYTPSGRLIQRDYKHLSLDEYFDSKNRENLPHTEIKFTDAGRKVYGGGGITPDIKVKAAVINPFQVLLLTRHLPFGFVRQMRIKYPQLVESAVINDLLLAEFRQFLYTHRIRYSEQDFQDNLSFIKRQIRIQMFTISMKYEESHKVALEEDPQILQALTSLPQAKALLQAGKKNIARNN